jgi:hypothetical protein
MLRKLERAGLQADLASVNALLASLHEDDDPIGFAQFSARRAEIEQALMVLGQVAEGTGKVALLFGGRPVWGSRGIEADFAAHAIDPFQRAVGAQAAGATGPVGTRGRLAQDAAPRLLVTDVGRGSFGFVLEEAADNAQLVETPTKHALDDIARLARAAAAPDEEGFNAAVEVIEPRALQALAEFFKKLHESGAQVRLVEGEEDFALDAEAVGRARARTEQTQIDTDTLEEEGVLIGLVPQRRSFEWRRPDGATIVGTVLGDVARDYEESLFADHPLLGPMRARFQVRSVSRRGGPARLAFTLLGVSPTS